MASYAISDLHGAYEEFHILLEKIRFRYDGSDSLYLLGDFGDWGKRSMETILAVKRLDERYDFVHCLMGNHEMMFLSAIEGGIQGDEASPSAVNWLAANRGLGTWNAYAAMPPGEQENLHRWLRGLPLSFDVTAGGKRIMLAHAYPYYYDLPYTPEEAARCRTDAVWRRLMLHENPFAGYTGTKHYDLLICGHTITDFYEQERSMEQNRSVPETALHAVPGGRNRIFHGDRFIDIDCGAKCMSIAGEEGDGLLRSVKRAILERSQLAAYCLETEEEFYVNRPQTAVGEMLVGAAAPEMELPPAVDRLRADLEIRTPGWRMPEQLQRTGREYPEIEVPEVEVPVLPPRRHPVLPRFYPGKEEPL